MPAVARATGLPRTDARLLIDAVLEDAARVIEAGDEVSLDPLGVIGFRNAAPRTGRRDRLFRLVDERRPLRLIE